MFLNSAEFGILRYCSSHVCEVKQILFYLYQVLILGLDINMSYRADGAYWKQFVLVIGNESASLACWRNSVEDYD